MCYRMMSVKNIFLMKLTGVKIKNFRVLKNVLVGQDWYNPNNTALNKATVLIGKNGTGKTTFIEAIKFISNIYRSGVSEALEIHGGTQFLRNVSCPGKDIEISLYFNHNNDLYEYRVVLGDDGIAPVSIVEETLSLKSQTDETLIYTGISRECLLENSFSSLSFIPQLKEFLNKAEFIYCSGKSFAFEDLKVLRDSPLVCIEHPETGVYWKTLLEFMEALKGVIASNTQFIVSTHNPIILSGAELSDIWMFNSKLDDSGARQVEATNMNVDKFKAVVQSAIEEDRNDTLGHLWVEGFFDAAVFGV